MTEKADDDAPASAGADEDSREQIWKDLAKAEADQAAATGEAQPDAPPEEPPEEPEQPPAEEPKAEAPAKTETPAADELSKLRHQFESSIGRIRAKDAEIAKLRKQIADAATRPPGDGNDESRKQREERLKRAVEDYGDVLSPVQEEILALRNELQSLKSERGQAGTEAKERLDSLIREEAARLQQMHPDFGTYLRDNQAAFREWIEDQPKLVREAAQRNHEQIVDADGAGYVFAQFKAHMANRSGGQPETLPDKRRAQLRGASTTRGQISRAAVSEEPHEDDDEGWWKYWQAKDRQAGR